MLVSRIESEAECEGTEESNEDDAIFIVVKRKKPKERNRKSCENGLILYNKDLDEITE